MSRASKPVVWHFNLPNHSKQLSLHLGSLETRKTAEQKFISQISTLNSHSINGRFSFNQFILGHGLMLLWFKDLMNATEKLQFVDPTFWHSRLVPSSGVILWLQLRGPFPSLLISCPFFWRGVNRRQVISRHHHDLKERGRSWYARLPNKGAGGNVDEWWLF